MELSASQKKYIEMEKRMPEIKAFLEEYRKAVAAVVDEVGLETYFQDEEGTVYKPAAQQGKFVHFEPFTILRTRRAGEKVGSLSLKEAKEAGYTVPEAK